MAYYDNQGGGNYANNPSLVVITSNNNPMHFSKGYYKAFAVTTDPNIVSAKKMVYVHHQCSNTIAGATYTNDDAIMQNESIVNNKIVTEKKDNYHTIPYYHYQCTHSKGYTVTDITTDFARLRNHRYRGTCKECGAFCDHGAIGHDWDDIVEADKQSEYARQAAANGNGISHKYGYTYDSTHFGIDKTYYERSSLPSGVQQVDETIVNGKVVSTQKGGCYTTPYYQYTYTTTTSKQYVATETRPSYNPISGGWNMVRFYYASEKDYNSYNYYKADTLYACGEYDQYPQGRYTYGTTTVSTNSTGYGTSLPNGAKLKATYYLKTCGYSNGQTIKATIIY